MLAPTNENPPAGRFSRLIRWNYTQAELRADAIAGLTVAAISLPQGMAYALLAGVDPRFGLYSAIVVTAVASIFGSSSHLINGPTSAISLVVFSALAFLDPEDKTEIAEALVLLGVMVGAIQILHRRLQARRPHPLYLRIRDPGLYGRRLACCLASARSPTSSASGNSGRAIRTSGRACG